MYHVVLPVTAVARLVRFQFLKFTLALTYLCSFYMTYTKSWQRIQAAQRAPQSAVARVAMAAVAATQVERASVLCVNFWLWFP